MYRRIGADGVNAGGTTRNGEVGAWSGNIKRNPEVHLSTYEEMLSLSPLPECAVDIETPQSTRPLSVGDIVAYESHSDTGRWLWSIGTILLLRKGEDSGQDEPASNGFLLMGSWKLITAMQSRIPSGDQKSKFGQNNEVAVANIRRRREEIQNDIDGLSRDLHVTEVIRSESLADTAREAIRRVGSNFWNEFYAVRHPPPSVRLAVQSVMALLRIQLLAKTDEEEWKEMLHFLQSEAFDDILAGETSVCSLDEGHTYLMTEHFLKNPLFAHDQISAGSHIAGLLQKWVTSELLSYGARAQLASIDERLDELNRESSQLSAQLRLYETSKPAIDEDEMYDDNVHVEAAKQLLAEKGEITILRCDETSSATPTAVFCRICVRPGVDSASLEALVIPKHLLCSIREAALDRDRRTSFCTRTNTPRQFAQTPRRALADPSIVRSPEAQTHYTPRLLGAYSQVDIFLEESLRREQLTVLELESLYNLHVLHAAAFHRLSHRAPQRTLSPSTPESAYFATHPDKKEEVDALLRQLRDAEDEIARLQGLLRAREAAVREAQESSAEHQRLLAQRQREFMYDSMKQDEAMERVRIAADEACGWLLLLLRDNGIWRHQSVTQLVRSQKAELKRLRSELAVREVCCARASLILREFVPSDTFSMDTCEGLHRAQEALRERGGPAPAPPRALPSRVASACPRNSPPRMPRRPPTEEETETLLRDCLTEALRDREVIQSVLLREQTQRRGLEDKVQELQEQIALDRDFPERSESSGYIRTPPTSARSPTRGGDINQQTTTRATCSLLQGTLASYSRQLMDVLAEEGRRDVSDDGPFADKVRVLRECLAEAHGETEKLRNERDAQAEDARMLEIYLRSAADALENALFHDERWRPRTTDSQCTTYHTRIFPGKGWAKVIVWTPDALHHALVKDIASACHLPEEYVQNVKFTDNGEEMHVFCNIRHDPNITDNEITTRLSECNFLHVDQLCSMHNGPEGGLTAMEKQALVRERELFELRKVISLIKDGRS